MFTGYNHEHYSDPTASKAMNLSGKAPCRPDHRPGCRNAGDSSHNPAHRPDICTPAQSPCSPDHNPPRESSSAPMIYVISPFLGKDMMEDAKYVLVARKFTRFVASQYKVPITPQLRLSRLSRDSARKELDAHILHSVKLLRRCDELWAFMPDNFIPLSMYGYLETAHDFGIPVRIFNKDMKEV